jgi:hypothetical protein
MACMLADTVIIAINRLQRAFHFNGLGVFPIALIPPLKLAGAIAAVLPDLEHGRDEDLDLDRFGSSSLCRKRSEISQAGKKPGCDQSMPHE